MNKFACKKKKTPKFASKRDEEGAKLETESQSQGAVPIIWHRDDFRMNLDGSSEIEEILKIQETLWSWNWY